MTRKERKPTKAEINRDLEDRRTHEAERGLTAMQRDFAWMFGSVPRVEVGPLPRKRQRNEVKR